MINYSIVTILVEIWFMLNPNQFSDQDVTGILWCDLTHLIDLEGWVWLGFDMLPVSPIWPLILNLGKQVVFKCARLVQGAQNPSYDVIEDHNTLVYDAKDHDIQG